MATQVKSPQLAAGVANENLKSSGHIVLTPDASKLVKVTVLEQIDTANTYRNNAVILTGWGAKIGNNTAVLSETVTFGITFATLPIIVIGNTANRPSGGAPAALSDFTNHSGYQCAEVISAAVGSFIAGLTVSADGGGGTRSFASSTYYGYTWIAIGSL